MPFGEGPGAAVVLIRTASDEAPPGATGAGVWWVAWDSPEAGSIEVGGRWSLGLRTAATRSRDDKNSVQQAISPFHQRPSLGM